jgi:hypothetical protein
MQNLAFVIVTLVAALAISTCNAAATVRTQLTHADAGRGRPVRAGADAAPIFPCGLADFRVRVGGLHAPSRLEKS